MVASTSQLFTDPHPARHEASDESDESDNEIRLFAGPDEPQEVADRYSWARDCGIIDLSDELQSEEEADIDMEELAKTEAGRDYIRFLNPAPIHRSYQKPIYKPTRKWRHTEGLDFEDVEVLATLRGKLHSFF
jgi:hypothetical protein